MKKFLAGVICILLLVTAGCAKESQQPQLTRVNIAFQEWVGYGLFYLAQEKGFFKEEGIDIVFVDEQLDSSRRDAFKIGMLDCEAGTLDLLISKRAQDTPITAVMEIDQSAGADGIVAVNNIKSLKDLIGKKVVFVKDDVSETFLSYLFYKEGFLMDGITVISRNPQDVAAAFLNNEADAAATWEPYLSQAAKRPGSHILITTKDEPGIIIDTLNIREDIVKNNPKLVKGLMRAYFKALEYYRRHTKEADKIIARHYDISPEEYARQVTGLKWVDYHQQDDSSEFDEWTRVFNFISEMKFKNKRIPGKPNVKDCIKTELLKTLYEDSK